MKIYGWGHLKKSIFIQYKQRKSGNIYNYKVYKVLKSFHAHKLNKCKYMY